MSKESLVAMAMVTVRPVSMIGLMMSTTCTFK